MRELFVQASYLVASVFFILGLKSLSRAETASRGVNLAAIGMLIAFSLFQWDGGRLAGYGEPPAGTTPKKQMLTYVGLVAAIPVAWLLLQNTILMAHAAGDAAGDERVARA